MRFSLLPLCSRSLPALALFALIGVIYAPTLTEVYGYQADFQHESYVATGQAGPWDNIYSQQGRYLLGILQYWSFPQVQKLEDLAYFRALAVGGIAVFAVTIYLYMRRQQWGLIASWAFALLATTTPAIALYAFWMVCWPYSWGCLAAFGCGVCFLRIVDETIPARSRGLIIAVGAILMLASLSIYQPVAGFALLPLLLQRQDHSPKSFRWRFSAVTCLWCGVYALYFIFFKLQSHFGISENWLGSGRAKIPAFSTERVDYLWDWILLPALSSWGHMLPQAGAYMVVIAVGATIAAIICLTRSIKRMEMMMWLLAAVVFITLNLLPIALSGYHDQSHRIVPFPTAIIVLFIVLALQKVGDRWSRRGRFISLGALLVLMSGHGFLAWQGVYYGLVKHAAIEASSLRTYLKSHFSSYPEGVVMIPARAKATGLALYPQRGEYGRAYSAWPHSDSALTILLKEQLGLQSYVETEDYKPPVKIILMCSEQIKGTPLTWPVIDWWTVLNGDTTAPASAREYPHMTEHRVFGTIETWWVYGSSSWAGLIGLSEDSGEGPGAYFWMPHLGTQWWARYGDWLLLAHETEGRLWTTPETFPVFKREATGAKTRLMPVHGGGVVWQTVEGDEP